MRSLRSVAVLALVLAFPLAAQARFGKANSPSHGSDSDSDSSSHSHESSSSHSSSSSSSSHQAVPVGTAPSHSGPSRYEGSRSGGYGYGGYNRGGYSYWHPGWYAWGFGYTPVWFAPTSPQPDYSGVQGQPAVVSTLEFHAQGLVRSPSAEGGGGAVGFMYGVEGPRFGLLIDTNSYFVSADDGTSQIDTIHLINAHLTWALASSPYGRLRLEGGLDSALAPDISFFGPGMGLSGAVGLFGSTSLEAALRVTPYPFTKVDWNAGLNFGMGTVALKVGWRQTYLNDQGQVDGVSHEDNFFGPYVGLALAL